jgi:DNA invertase Pin-like site-specific DNA recombinase
MTMAYSYLRFSSPQQAAGDSIRRQTENRERWLTAHPSVRFDRSLVITDAGRSGFRRKNWDTYALARFVDCIKSGRVEVGSYLLVENLDRLSREDVGEATELFLSIVNRGVVIVQLSPAVMEFRRPVDIMQLMFAVVELSRGHSESAIKSERGRASWARKQKEAASRIVTRKLPGWIKHEDGKLVLDERGAETVRRLFSLALDGYGASTIAQKLNAEGVPVLGRKEIAGRGQSHLPPDKRQKRPVLWSGAVVWHILKSRAIVGEYVPYRRRRDESVGTPVPNYFPAVIDSDTFHAVNDAIKNRGRVGRGRRGRGSHINLFAGLLRDARDGGTLSYWHTGKHPAVLISVNAKEGRGTKWVSFPARVFEAAVLSELVEIEPAEVQGDRRSQAAGRLDAIDGRLRKIDALIKRWTDKMDDLAIVDTVAAKLSELKEERKKLAAEQAEARREAAGHPAEAWGEFRSLAQLLKENPSDEMRLKVRTALRQNIESVFCLFTPCKRDRFAAVQIHFASGGRRDYLIWRRSPLASARCGDRLEKRPGFWMVTSYRASDLAKIGLPQPDLAGLYLNAHADCPGLGEQVAEYFHTGNEVVEMEEYLASLTTDEELRRLTFSGCKEQVLE